MPSNDVIKNRLNTVVSSPQLAFGALLRVTVYRQSLDVAAPSCNFLMWDREVRAEGDWGQRNRDEKKGEELGG
jgi:hypothetical protein